MTKMLLCWAAVPTAVEGDTGRRPGLRAGVYRHDEPNYTQDERQQRFCRRFITSALFRVRRRLRLKAALYDRTRRKQDDSLSGPDTTQLAYIGPDIGTCL